MDNVLCIVDQCHQRSVIEVDHSRKVYKHFVDGKPTTYGLNIENGGILITNFREKKRGNPCLNLRKRKVKN